MFEDLLTLMSIKRQNVNKSSNFFFSSDFQNFQVFIYLFREIGVDLDTTQSHVRRSQVRGADTRPVKWT